MARRVLQLPQRFLPQVRCLFGHTPDAPVHSGVEAGRRDGDVLCGVGIADSDGGAGLAAAVGIEKHQFAVGVVFDRFVDGLQIGQVLRPIERVGVLPLPRLIFQPVVKDGTRLVRRRNVLPLRPVGMLIL